MIQIRGSKKIPPSKLWDGVTIYAVAVGNPPRNMLVRMQRTLEAALLSAKIFCTINLRMAKSQTLTNRLAQLNPAFFPTDMFMNGDHSSKVSD